MKKLHFAALLLALAVVTGAQARPPAAPQPSKGIHIDNGIYAQCTASVWKTLGTPPIQAANFVDLWIAHAYYCALWYSEKSGR